MALDFFDGNDGGMLVGEYLCSAWTCTCCRTSVNAVGDARSAGRVSAVLEDDSGRLHISCRHAPLRAVRVRLGEQQLGEVLLRHHGRLRVLATEVAVIVEVFRDVWREQSATYRKLDRVRNAV